MVYEYALEPEFVATWGKKENYYQFKDKFGLGQPRLASAYPSRNEWKKKKRAACEDLAKHSDNFEKKRLVEIFNIITEKMIRREDIQYDNTLTWLKNAENEHNNRPFQQILALKRFSENMVSKLEIRRDFRIYRTCNEMAESVHVLLKNSCKVFFIDKYFDPSKARYINSFRSFLQALIKDRFTPKPSIEIHTLRRVNSNIFRNLSEIIPKGLSVKVMEWKERDGGERLKDRYILTEIGGVGIEAGLDEGRPGSRTRISLLSRETYEELWEIFYNGKNYFDLIGERSYP